TTWRLNVPLQPGTNSLRITARDRRGNLLPATSRTITVEYTGPEPAPSENVVINEIMSNPAVPEASFVELWNTSAQHAFDLSGWHLAGLDFTFPPGTLLTNGQFLVLAKNRAAF